MKSTNISNITDVPRRFGERDLLGTDNYSKALENFIFKADTPMTIAIQGEWGSGKTSMMNQIRANLCEGDSNPFVGIWLNTWQYSLFCSEEVALMRIIKGIFDQVVEAIDDGSNHEALKRARKIAGGVFRGAAKIGLSLAGQGAVANQVVSDIAGDATEDEPTITDLRRSLEEAVSKYMETSDKKGFLIFIDDLDRLHPKVAVDILELLKNIFDLDKCVFLLAIDYDVVVKGLEPKFGPLTEKNEREFRAFFDKIIQLPFSMPLGSYEIDSFLMDSLKRIGYFNEGSLEKGRVAVTLSQMSTSSIGRNPRAMKRLTNILSLIQIFNELSPEASEANDEAYERVMNFGLICLQLAYPKIYKLLAEDPNYLEWNEDKAEELRLKPIDEDVAARLDNTDVFDDAWEKFVFRVCQGDPYMESNSANISSLLNLIAEQYPKTESRNFSEILEDLLSLASVTEVDVSNIQGSRKKGERVFFETIDDWMLTRKELGFKESGLLMLKRAHDLVLECCNEKSIDVNVRMSGMLNFYAQGSRKAFMISWPTKGGMIHIGMGIPEGDDPMLPVENIKNQKGNRTQYFFKEMSDLEFKSDTLRQCVMKSIDNM